MKRQLPDISFGILFLPFNWRITSGAVGTTCGIQIGPLFLGMNWFPASAESEASQTPTPEASND